MSDLWLRLGLIIALFGLAVLVGIALRRRAARRPAVIDVSGLAPGVYFFSSATCQDCRPARDLIEATLGSRGFREVSWEEQPATFAEVGIGVVPSTVVVDETGSGRLYEGIPVGAL